jgi:hypothetical protein
MLAEPPRTGLLGRETGSRKEQLVKAATLRRRVVARKPHNDDDEPSSEDDPVEPEAYDNVQKLPEGFGPEMSPDDLE